jgi:hypothetical protein
MHDSSTLSPNRRSILPAILALIASAAAATIAYASQNLTATADVNGKPRSATAEITEPSAIRCTSATAQPGDGPKPSCQIQSPGHDAKLDIGKLLTLEKPGYITLTCNGNPPLRCTAEITP